MITLIVRREAGWFDWENGLVTDSSYWQQICLAYNVDKIIFISELIEADPLNITTYKTLPEALAVVTGQRIFLEVGLRATEIGREPIYLQNYVHPQNAIYIFGRTGLNNISFVEENDILLSVEQESEEGDMFALTMAAIVLHDRMVKTLP